MSARDFVSWLLEDIDTVYAEAGTPRDEQLRAFANDGFLRFVGCIYATNEYEIITEGFVAFWRAADINTAGEQTTNDRYDCDRNRLLCPAREALSAENERLRADLMAIIKECEEGPMQGLRQIVAKKARAALPAGQPTGASDHD